VPDVTWVASVSPIVYVGATPVFADIEKDSWCLCPVSFERNITSKTKAVVVVDLLGNTANWDKIKEVALAHNIAIIEDAAEGLGATYKGKQAGTFGKISLFSFSPTKLVTAGQGGALMTDDEELFQKCKLFAHHGIVKGPKDPYFWSHVLGYNYNWTNIQAALALAQLRRIDDLIATKKKLFQWYKERLDGFDGVSLNVDLPDVEPTYWITVAIIDAKFGLSKEQIGEKLAVKGIDFRPMFYPVSSMPPFHGYYEGKDMSYINPVGYDISARGICLPAGNNLVESDVDYVCEQLKKILMNA
jgi:perosamine synthetase